MVEQEQESSPAPETERKPTQPLAEDQQSNRLTFLAKTLAKFKKAPDQTVDIDSSQTRITLITLCIGIL